MSPVNEMALGILAVLIGLVACLAGYVVFRLVLPILGFLVGLGLGAQLAATLFDQPYLGSPLSWIVAIAIGLVVATIAFVWWYVSVALTIAGLGYAIGFGAARGIGTGADVALIAGVVVAVVFALIALLLRVPIGVVIVVTAFWGSSALIAGVLLLVNRIDPSQLRNGSVDVVTSGSPLLIAVWIALGVVGVLVQWLTTSRREQPLAEAPVV